MDLILKKMTFSENKSNNSQIPNLQNKNSNKLLFKCIWHILRSLLLTDFCCLFKNANLFFNPTLNSLLLMLVSQAQKCSNLLPETFKSFSSTVTIWNHLLLACDSYWNLKLQREPTTSPSQVLPGSKRDKNCPSLYEAIIILISKVDRHHSKIKL